MSLKLKDPFCALSHWAGVGLGVAGWIYLMLLAQGSAYNQLALSFYCLGIVALYLASASYHSVQSGSKKEGLLQKLDHSAIYLMIFASYVPICLIALRGSLGYGMIAAQVLFAAVGIFLTFKLKKVPGKVRVVLYLSMGWMAVIGLGSLSHVLPKEAIWWLLAEGIVYSVGAIIYVVDKPHLWPGKFSAHDLWHVFVLGGSVCHFVLNAGYIARLP